MINGSENEPFFYFNKVQSQPLSLRKFQKTKLAFVSYAVKRISTFLHSNVDIDLLVSAIVYVDGTQP